MRLYPDIPVTTIGDTGRSFIHAEHNGQRCSFLFSMYKRENFVETDVFSQINAYWAQQTPAFQETLFNLFRDAESAFADLFNKRSITEDLNKIVVKIYEMHPVNNIRLWMQNNTGFPVPSTFKTVYEDDPDRNTSPAKTYLVPDYRELQLFSFMMRPMLPIWVTYVRKIKSETRRDAKEMQAFKLLENTQLSTCPGLEKLLVYIKANLRKEANNMAPESFVSDEDYPYLLLAQVAVRKLAIGDLNPVNQMANLVTLVSNFIKSRTMYPEGDLASQLRTKSVSDNGDEDQKTSVLESVRYNTEISVLESVELQVSANAIDKQFQLTYPYLTQAEFDAAYATARIIELKQSEVSVRVLPPQRTLSAWVLKKALMPFGFDYLDTPVQVKCLALTQALLWAKGFRYLAVLSTAVADIDDEQHIVATSLGKSRVPEELQQQLREVFPHVRKIRSRKAPEREECPVTEGIEEVTQELSTYNWQATCSPQLLKEVFGDDRQRRVPILPDIRIELTKLAIAVGTNQF